MYKNRFGINNLQWLMCHKTKQNQTKQAAHMETVQQLYVFPVQNSILTAIEKARNNNSLVDI